MPPAPTGLFDNEDDSDRAAPAPEADVESLLLGGRYAEVAAIATERGDDLLLLRCALLGSDVTLVAQTTERLRRASREHMQKACRLLERHQHYGGAALLRELLSETEEALLLYERAGQLLDVARLHERAGRGPQALAIYQELVGALSEEGAGKESARDLDHATADEGLFSVRAHLGLGRLLQRSGQHEQAIAPLQQSRALLLSSRRNKRDKRHEPEAQRTLDEIEVALIEALCAVGHPDVARPILESYLGRHPELPQAQTAAEFVARHARHTLTPSGPPTLLGRYKLLALLGAGGMGRVYLADDEATGRRVALKLLPLPSGGLVPLGAPGETAGAPAGSIHDLWRRFQQEAATLRRLRHPNIVEILDFFPAAGVLVMEHLAGGSLAQLPLPAPLRLVQAALLDVLAGLAAAHAAGVLHRDLKPHNLLRSESGQTKIADFGAAQLSQLGATQTESLVGTLAYLSPEQIEGRPLSFAADVYTLGVTLYQLLTGRLPFSGPDFVSQHLREVPADPLLARPTLPAPWAALCLSLLAKAPSARIGSIEELRELVRSLPVDEAVSSSPAAAEEVGRGVDEHGAALQPGARAAPPPPPALPGGGDPAGPIVLSTAYSTVHQEVDLRLGRAVLVERFRPGAFQSEAGARHHRWLRGLAALGGPGVQRVLRIDLSNNSVNNSADNSAASSASGPAPVVHYELPAGPAASTEQQLDEEDAALLRRALASLHERGLVHGAVRTSVVIEPLAALLVLHGRGPLGWLREAKPEDDLLELATLTSRGLSS